MEAELLIHCCLDKYKSMAVDILLIANMSPAFQSPNVILSESEKDCNNKNNSD